MSYLFYYKRHEAPRALVKLCSCAKVNLALNLTQFSAYCSLISGVIFHLEMYQTLRYVLVAFYIVNRDGNS
jgi:hypothetical protein